LLELITRLNRLVYLKTFVSFECKLKVRIKICCSKRITKPTPNSTAENIKKKKVKDNKLRLS